MNLWKSNITKYSYIKVGYSSVCDSSNMRFTENGHLLHLHFSFLTQASVSPYSKADAVLSLGYSDAMCDRVSHRVARAS